MANMVEFLIKIRDLNSGSVFGRLGQTGDGAFSRLARSSNNFQRSFSGLGSSIDQIESKLKDLERTRNMSIDGRQIRQINREMRELEERRGRLTGSSSGGSGFGKIAGLVGLGSALALGGTVMKLGMERQMAGTAFDTMAGKKQGGDLHKSLIKYATDSIYGNEVFGEAQTMLGFGINVKKVLPDLKMLGDISEGNVEHMKSLTLAFSQSAAAGRLMGQDARQMIDAGFNPLQAMSEKTGKSLAVLNGEMSAGKISFQQVTEAFQYATGPMGKYYKGMENMANTSTGKWMAFTGALETLGGTVGTTLLPILGGVATVLNKILGYDTAIYITAAGIGAMATAWGLYTLWTQRAAFWTSVVNNKMAFSVIGGIGLLVSVITFLALKFDGWGTSAKAAWNITKLFFSDLKIGITDFAQTIAYVFQSAFYRIKDFLQQIGHAWQKVKKGDFSDSPFTSDASKKLADITRQHAIDRLANQKGLLSNNTGIGAQWGKVGLKWHTDASGKETSSGKSPVDIVSGKAATGSMPSSMADTNKSISGGGVRNLTINVGNLGTGKIDIHTTTMGEGLENLRRQFEEMFLQVVNSGNAAVAQ